MKRLSLLPLVLATGCNVSNTPAHADSFTFNFSGQVGTTPAVALISNDTDYGFVATSGIVVSITNMTTGQTISFPASVNVESGPKATISESGNTVTANFSTPTAAGYPVVFTGNTALFSGSKIINASTTFSTVTKTGTFQGTFQIDYMDAGLMKSLGITSYDPNSGSVQMTFSNIEYDDNYVGPDNLLAFIDKGTISFSAK